MSRSRRAQRSVRGVVAAGLMFVGSLLVASALLTGTALGAAAVTALLTGVVACRIIYTEVTQTRRDAARQYAEQAQSFGAEMTQLHHEHRTFTASIGARLAEREYRIVELEATVRLSEHRAAEARSRLDAESRRADESREQLSALLDEVLSQPPLAMVDREPNPVPPVVDLLAWEGRVTAAVKASQVRPRRQA